MNKSLIAGGSVCLAWAAAALAGLPEGKDINEWFDEMAVELFVGAGTV